MSTSGYVLETIYQFRPGGFPLVLKKVKSVAKVWVYLPHPLNPPLHDMNISSYYEGEFVFGEGAKLPSTSLDE